jgi:hypothetical protein
MSGGGMNLCARCMAKLTPGATFCSSCGTPAAPPHPGYGPPPGAYAHPGHAPPAYQHPGQPPAHPQHGYGPPGAPQHGYGPPGAPHPGYGHPAHHPGYGQPAPGAPAPEGEGSGKWLGGCGLAGCLGAVFAVLLIGGVIGALWFVNSNERTARSPETPTQGRGNTPSSGSLRDLVTPRIGSYQLVESAKVTKLGEKLQGGVVDSLAAVYRAPDGTKVTEILLVYDAESTTVARMEAVFRALSAARGAGEQVRRTTTQNREGVPIGSRIELSGGNPQHVYWSNKRLLVIVTAPPPHAVGFEKATTY